MDTDDRLIALYTRKSKFTGKGESIENQIELCKKSLINKYGNEILNQIVIFEDEGFTGANTNRPQFQKMITEFKSKRYCMLVVYRLDRISRNVSDFCSLIEKLSDWDVDFISITESFDTSTPMGKAMLMITSVFAQLERDTIAERIRDNMYELAKTGRWLGGTTPLGYVSKKIEKYSLDNRKKSLYKLTFDEEDIKKTKIIFTKYMELKSISKLETYLIKNNIKTRKEVYFSRFALSTILRNLVYCKNDKDIKDFLEKKGVTIFDNDMRFDGKYGLISYNKRTQKKSSNGKARKDDIKDITKWVVAIGKHQGIINGKDWINIWNTLETRRYNKRTAKVNIKVEALLSGIIRCAKCTSFMRPKVLKTYDSKGKRNFMYVCELKSKSRKKHCNCINIKGIEVDNSILNFLKTIEEDQFEVIKILKEAVNQKRTKIIDIREIELQNLIKIFDSNQNKIKGLLNKLALIDKDMVSIVTEEIKLLKYQNTQLEISIKTLKDEIKNTKKIKNISAISLNLINHYFQSFENNTTDEKREMIKELISYMIYDNGKIIIKLFNGSDIGHNLGPSRLSREVSRSNT